jgi:hypothetical protein
LGDVIKVSVSKTAQVELKGERWTNVIPGPYVLMAEGETITIDRSFFEDSSMKPRAFFTRQGGH